MQELIEKLPVLMEAEGAKVQGVDWGDMKVSYMQLPKGTDAAPLLEGLPDNLCPCPQSDCVTFRFKQEFFNILNQNLYYDRLN